MMDEDISDVSDIDYDNGLGFSESLSDFSNEDIPTFDSN